MNGNHVGLPPELDPQEPSEVPHREPPIKEPRRAPAEPQPPLPPDTPDFHKENKDRKDALAQEDEFLKEEVLGQGAEQEMDPQNVQSDIEKTLEDRAT